MIHKINPNLQEHQSFLAQNRKDPITGDSISESDEVVFCAGCKSVFLKDTWEYLGEEHCEQRGTLKNFPLSSLRLDFTTKDDILFYSFLLKDELTYLAHRLNFTTWQPKKRRHIKKLGIRQIVFPF